METVEQLVTFNHIQIQLNGGAPWGFTLKGGLEHGEPLIITKIEEGGRASQCENLRVGDELVNINGSALYGSRQEALILIKGSYRILKITVRRRTVPVIRPSSWHLAKISDPPLPPLSLPPPPLPPSETSPPPPPPSAMQLHPGPCPPLWHSADNSDLSLPWGHLSRHYPTDRSTSLGSMESLDPPSQTNYDSQNSPGQTAYYDPHLSPVDPTIFISKRDSAYSSFSASSNASDYTLPLRPGEACSMDNLLHGLGPACRGCPSGDASSLGSMAGESQDESGLKSRSLTRPKVRSQEARERPSSYCYEEERREGGGGEGRRGGGRVGPPEPPTRNDSFRATRGHPGVTESRRSSTQVGISSPSCCSGNDHISGATAAAGQIVNGYRSESPVIRNRKGESSCGSLTSQGGEDQENHKPLDPSLSAPTRASPSSIVPCPDPSLELPGEIEHLHPQDKHSSSGLHRHSAPEKLLEVSSDRSDPSDRSVSPPCRQWSHSPLQALRVGLAEDQWGVGTTHLQTQDKWGSSRCSTPGSVLTDADGEVGDGGQRLEGLDRVAGSSLSSIQQLHTWGRSISVPGQPYERFTQGGVNSDRVLERNFGPLSTAASMDTLLVEQRKGLDGEKEGGGGRGGGVEGSEGEAVRRSSSSRNHRRSRRRSERFATNLRNEIQRKKAQLQKSKGPSGLLYSGDTVHEEEGLDLQGEVKERGAPDYRAQERASKIGHSPALHPSTLEAPAPGSLRRGCSASTPQLHLPSLGTNDLADSFFDCLQTQTQDPSRSTLRSDRFRPDCGVGIRVIEEPAPAGKARRWRWTPEHKLQPDHDIDQPLDRSKVVGSRLSSSSSVCSLSSRMEESDILPFADRRKFFEESSRSMSVTNLSGLTSRRQRPDRHGRHQHPSTLEHQGGGHCQGLAQRRYSYQGGILQESPMLPNMMEARRQSVSSEREKEKERERERMREWEREERVREKEREREERMKEREREREDREHERLMELERARLREIEREREKEERVREWERQREREVERERERQRELQLERELELERERERELELERLRERERELERERERELELEREREKERELERERERELERAKERELELERERKEREREERSFLSSAQDFQPGLQEKNHPQNEYSYSVQTHVYTQAFPPSQAQNQACRSAFHPVNNPLSQDNRGFNLRSYTLTETPSIQSGDQTQLYRKFSLTEREFPGRSTHSRPPEGSSLPPLSHQEQQHGCQAARPSACGRDGERSPPLSHPSSPLPPPSPSPLRGRAMSENDLRFATCRPTARFLPVAAGSSRALSEVEEAGREEGEGGGVTGATRKRTPPPPRPPPPKWEQFHRRRASHHNLYTSSPLFPPSSSSSSASLALPPPSSPALPPCPQESPRLRSHSLPPQREELHVYHQAEERPLSQAPPSPRFTHRAFRPVAPPHREEDTPPPGGYQGDKGGQVDTLSPRPTSESCVRLSEADSGCHRQQRPAAEWTRTTSPRGPSSPLENGGVAPVEPYLSMSCEKQQLLMKTQNHGGFHNHHRPNRVPEPQQTLEPQPEPSPSPAHSLEAELDIPTETDIDDYPEEGLPEDEEPIRNELQCFALPVMVLETDMDSMPEQEASSAGRLRAERGSVEVELEVGTRDGLLDELFPHEGEGEAGTESWRGGYPRSPMENSSDSLDRRSGASSSSSSYYSPSTAKLLTDCCCDQDQELAYKKQLMERLRKKLGVLREAQKGLLDDIRANTQLGEEMESLVVSVCKPSEVDKFRMFIGDLDKVVSLLLSLSGQLLRVESSLNALEPLAAHHERLPLLEKKQHLLEQLAEAQGLKEHVDRREQAVARALALRLAPEQHRDYSHFVKMKGALLVEQRQLEDKIRLGEEQLRGLRESLGLGLGPGPGLGPGMGPGLGYGHY